MTRTLLSIALVVGCSSSRDKPAPGATPPSKNPARVPGAVVGDDRNITAADYIGPEACGECHAPQFAQWTASLHRVMNRKVDDAGAVVGDFAGARLPYKAGEARFERDLVGYVMTTSDGERIVRYRVTRTIGHRGLQEYVGVVEPASVGESAGSSSSGSAGGSPQRDEVRLPFGWWPRGGGWAAQVAFDPWLDEAQFDPFAPVREPWAERCPWCHSTYPFAQRIARGSGESAVGHGLEQFFTSEPGSARLDIAAQVSTGISCESCHLGGRAHAAGAPIQFLPRGAAPRPDAPALPATFAEQRTSALVVNTVCAQCHSGPSPRLADGTALRNSSEALDLAASPCEGLRCTDCHDPHVADGQPDEAKAIAVCVTCHATQAVPTHAGTGEAGVGHESASCLDCHMPRVVMGIDRYVRTHRISSPTNPRLLGDAAPNACNLCHLDRSLDWTLTELRLGWDVRLPGVRDRSAAALGDAWLASSSPAIRLIAAHAYARSPLGPFALAELRKGLADPLPYVQVWTRFAVETIEKRK